MVDFTEYQCSDGYLVRTKLSCGRQEYYIPDDTSSKSCFLSKVVRVDYPPRHPTHPNLSPDERATCFFGDIDNRKKSMATYALDAKDDDDWVSLVTFAGPVGHERVVLLENPHPKHSMHCKSKSDHKHSLNVIANGDKKHFVGSKGHERLARLETSNGANVWYDTNGQVSHVQHDDGAQFAVLHDVQEGNPTLIATSGMLATLHNRANRIRNQAAKQRHRAAFREEERRALVLAHWRCAIRAQIKRNRHNRVATAENRVETRRQEVKRTARRASNASRPTPTLTPVGRSGPTPRTAWAAEAATVSEIAKREGKKEIGREEIHARAEAKQEAERVGAARVDCMQRHLQIARLLGDGRD